ncbi:uncharacterized protein PpBr36_10024 [Pyricularia pennisetigena]|uniref:uncharacterized protein n=1 Tax=Pyricularia pennisetigena TaxID=1578925 RepID=UPI001150AEB0|nr:uncharacterized protein PpBr36_10024 [Pyricularia pennisetigena]TLS22444.1 hypothetical protein PpBr36_10024 [Pyricularia pennisetigena]
MCQFSISEYASCGHIVFERPEPCLFKGSELLCESFPMKENRYRHLCPRCTMFPISRADTIFPPQSHLRKAYSLPTLSNSMWRPFRPRSQTPVDWRRTRMVQKLLVDRVKEQVSDRARKVGVEPAEMPVPSALLWCIREEGEEVGSLNWGADTTADRASCASRSDKALDWCWITEDSVAKAAAVGMDNGVCETKRAMTAKGASVTEPTPSKYIYHD